MKSLIVILSFLSCAALAEDVGLKVNDIHTEQDTTIQIKKGTTENTYELTTGSDEVEGDAAPLLKEARANWKKACSEWKTEKKDLNKENQIISLNCGHMNCSTSSMETTCTSQGTYKIRVKVK